MGKRDRKPRTFLLTSGLVKHAQRRGRLLPVKGISFVILRSLANAIECELVRIIQEPLATGSAGGSVQNAIEVLKPVDLLFQVIWRQDREAGVAEAAFVGLAEAPDRALIGPCVRVVLGGEHARDATMFFVSTGKLAGTWSVHLDEV